MADDRTQELDEGFALIFKALLAGVHTITIGEVVSFDRDKQKASIQPALKRLIDGGDPEALPQCDDVPVAFMGSGDYWLTFDVKPKSYVILLICERAIDKWKNEGGIVDPAIKRRFHISDGVAIAGLNPFSDPLGPIDADSISLRNRDGSTAYKIIGDILRAENGGGFFELSAAGQFNANDNFTVDK